MGLEEENKQLRKLLEDYYIQVAIGKQLENATPQDIEQWERDMDALQSRAEEWLPSPSYTVKEADKEFERLVGIPPSPFLLEEN